jgi:hypothetical protein
MAANTQLVPSATPSRRYGAYAGRTASAHGVGRITQQAPSAVPGRRYGSFAGRTVGGGAGSFWLFGDAERLSTVFAGVLR